MSGMNMIRYIRHENKISQVASLPKTLLVSALVPSFTPAAAVSDVKFKFKNDFEYITQIALSLKTLLVSSLVSSGSHQLVLLRRKC